MPSVDCPIPGCTYTTPDLDAVIVAALLNTHATIHAAPTPHVAGAAVRVERVKRPTISSAGTSEDWKYFLSRWGEYTTATKVTGKDRILQLLECCDEVLRKDLTRSTVGSLTVKTEDNVLEAMRSLAVREENVMVARVSLNNMHQDRDESIRSFGARLRGQACVCKYVTECPVCHDDVDFTEPILRDVLCRGISDTDIQLDLLGHTKQDMTLEEVLRFVEAKEAGKRSATRLLDHQAAGAIKSSYSKTKREALLSQSTNTGHENSTCSYCGMKGHGDKSNAAVRKTSCPAYNHICGHCQHAHHFERVCRSKDKTKFKPKSQAARVHDIEGAVFDALCSIETPIGKPLGQSTAGHHRHNRLTNNWVEQPSKPQPFLNLSVRIVDEDYQQLGFQPIINSNPKAITLRALADTGCQSCLAGFQCIQRLGLTTHDLIPVKIKMHTANDQPINILGAVIIRISGVNRHGGTTETRQFTYITNDSDKLFLSKGACIDLGMITNNFPTVDETTANAFAGGDASADSSTTNCTCPKRTLPPPLPTELPHPATKDNHRVKLQNFLLDYYGTSTFNTCEHQPLPLMVGPPLKLMIDSDADPVAFHTPIPVPIHWQREVKADLDRDVQLGVIEPVPVGEPVTWCHRMVVCAKKNGKPRRTVDFQPLNAHATRETHHTQSPFHQVRSVPYNTKKTVSDAWNGYHSVPLRHEDRHYTAFITPWGRYRYCTTPQGYISSGDGYSRRFDEIVYDFPNKIKVIDDALLWADTLEQSFFQTCQWLDTCGRNGIIQNPTKFVFGADTVEFSGFEITTDDVKPCQRIIRTIADFPRPKHITDIRSWFGLVNQVSYAFSMTDKMIPFRELLKSKSTFYGDAHLQRLFEESKLKIIKEIEHGVKIFDKSMPTCLTTDWSKTGLGFWLFQKHCSCPGTIPFCCTEGWKTVLVGSRFTHPAESR